MSDSPTSKPFNFHAWATRNSDGAGRKYTIQEHLTYVGVALLLLIESLVVGLWLIRNGAEAAHQIWTKVRP